MAEADGDGMNLEKWVTVGWEVGVCTEYTRPYDKSQKARNRVPLARKCEFLWFWCLHRKHQILRHFQKIEIRVTVAQNCAVLRTVHRNSRKTTET